MIGRIIGNTNQTFFSVLKLGWVALLLGAIGLEVPIQSMAMYQRQVEENLKAMGGQFDTVRLFNQIFIMLFESLSGAYILFVAGILAHALYTKSQPEVLKATKESAVPLTVESLRALGKTILGFVLFVLPGFYFYLRYSQIPYVVMFSDAYKSGKADALKLSHYLTVGYGWLISIFLILTGVISLGLSVLKDSYPPSENAAVFGVCFLLYFLVQVYICVMSYFLYNELYLLKKDTIS